VFPGATPLDYAFIGSFNFSMAMLVAPAVTVTARRYGTQAPMLLGIVFQTTGFISASFASEIWHLYLSQGLLVGLGQGFVYIPSIAILSQWFTTKRSLANGISGAGSGVGGIIFSFAASALISHISLAWSLRITAIITASMNLLATLLIRNRNEVIRPPQLGLDRQLLRRYDVLLLLSWGFISMLGYMTLLYSLSDFAISIDIDYTKAASVVAFLNLGTAVGRPLIGISSDKYGRMEVAGILTFVCGVSCFAIWLPANSYGMTVFFALISGAILGVYWVVRLPRFLHCFSVTKLCFHIDNRPSLRRGSWARRAALSTISSVAFHRSTHFM
jgi:MFS family permease